MLCFIRLLAASLIWLIVAFGLVTIELNEPGNGCFTGSSNTTIDYDEKTMRCLKRDLINNTNTKLQFNNAVKSIRCVHL